MLKSTLCLFIALFMTPLIFAQDVICGYDLVVQQMEKKYPGYRKAINKTFEQAKANSSDASHSHAMTYNIPVVVHVVWKEGEEQLTESLINSQIEILNQDFQRLNDDADNIRDIFEDVVGNPMISFTLEEILYIETAETFSVNLVSGAFPEEVKQTSAGGSDPWDVERYLNIWICQIQPLIFAGQNAGQILGYAYPPNDLDNWPIELQTPNPNYDGVVLDYRVVGKDNPISVDLGLGMQLRFDKGRTAVHEVGHYLGLRHTWGDGNPTSINSCNFDDGIEDTPNSGAAAIFNCDFTQNTCSASVDDLPDMIENFMDTSDEACQNSFSNGQIALMRGVLENQRCKLIASSFNCSVSTQHLQSIHIDLYPNPGNGFFYLETGAFNMSDFELEIYDTSGKVYPVILKNNLLDISNLTAGVYYFRGTNAQQVFLHKLVNL